MSPENEESMDEFKAHRTRDHVDLEKEFQPNKYLDSTQRTEEDHVHLEQEFVGFYSEHDIESMSPENEESMDEFKAHRTGDHVDLEKEFQPNEYPDSEVMHEVGSVMANLDFEMTSLLFEMSFLKEQMHKSHDKAVMDVVDVMTKDKKVSLYTEIEEIAANNLKKAKAEATKIVNEAMLKGSDYIVATESEKLIALKAEYEAKLGQTQAQYETVVERAIGKISLVSERVKNLEKSHRDELNLLTSKSMELIEEVITQGVQIRNIQDTEISKLRDEIQMSHETDIKLAKTSMLKTDRSIKKALNVTAMNLEEAKTSLREEYTAMHEGAEMRIASESENLKSYKEEFDSKLDRNEAKYDAANKMTMENVLLIQEKIKTLETSQNEGFETLRAENKRAKNKNSTENLFEQTENVKANHDLQMSTLEDKMQNMISLYTKKSLEELMAIKFEALRKEFDTSLEELMTIKFEALRKEFDTKLNKAQTKSEATAKRAQEDFSTIEILIEDMKKFQCENIESLRVENTKSIEKVRQEGEHLKFNITDQITNLKNEIKESQETSIEAARKSVALETVTANVEKAKTVLRKEYDAKLDKVQLKYNVSNEKTMRDISDINDRVGSVEKSQNKKIKTLEAENTKSFQNLIEKGEKLKFTMDLDMSILKDEIIQSQETAIETSIKSMLHELQEKDESIERALTTAMASIEKAKAASREEYDAKLIKVQKKYDASNQKIAKDMLEMNDKLEDLDRNQNEGFAKLRKANSVSNGKLTSHSEKL